MASEISTNPFAARLSAHREFFNLGSTRDWRFRDAQLAELQKLILEREDDIYLALKNDLGKPRQEAFLSEIAILIAEIKFTRKNLRKWMTPKKVPTPLTLQPAKSRIHYEPKGVVLIISPWNYPFLLAISPLVGAIAAGCCAVVKPSELAPETGTVVEGILKHLFEPNYISFVEGGVHQTQNLLALKFDHIFFTGSPTVGRIIAKAAAEHLTSTTLELGGKNPTIVSANSDLDLAARRIIWGKTVNAGQTCLAPDTVFVEASVKKALVEKMQAQIKIFFGDMPEQSADFGRIVNRGHTERLKRLLSSGTVVAGGETNENSNFVAPTLLTQVKPNAEIMTEEIFGPVLPLLEYYSLDDLLKWLNTKSKPLAAYLFSESKDEQRKFLTELAFGGGCINDTVMHFANPHLPFGGVGESGSGAYHGKLSFDVFTHAKPIVTRSKRFNSSVRYPPYTDLKWRMVRRLFGLKS